MDSRTQDHPFFQASAQNSVNYQLFPNANLDMILTTSNTRRGKRKLNPEYDMNNTPGPSKRPHISTGSPPNGIIAGIEHVSAEGWVDPHLKTAMTIGTPRRYDLMVGNASAGPNRPGVFENAQNVLLKNPHMVDIGTQNVFVNDPSDATLPWLREYTMPGAEFDSSARDPPPRCHPGTRTAIIQRAQDWFNDSNREKKLLWLHGPAGVGKSAIVQTVAEIESKSQRLGASLFFSRSNHLNQPEKVFPTIAYQLAVRDPSYKAYIAELMADPGSLDKAISEQFMKLIVEPLVKRNIRKGSAVWIIALDGLDECDGTREEPSSQARPRPGRHSDDYQRKIVELIIGFVLDYPSVPLIWVIASRPEPHLKAVFSHQGVIPSFWEEDIPVDSDEACSDVEGYLRSEFDAIRGKYPDHISSEIWPSNNEFLRITKAASGLFAFAAVIILFIDDPWVANPVDQLDIVLSVVGKLSRLDNQLHPLAVLDAMYTEILRRIPSNVWPVTKQLLSTSMLLLKAPRTLVYMCNVLDIKQGTAVTALRHLHSVIKLPRHEKIGNLSLKFYHASFKDYLKDPSRSHEYVIDAGAMQNVANEWWWGMFRIIRQRTAVTLDILDPELGSMPRPNNISFSWPPNKATEKKIMAAAGKMWGDFILGRFQENYYKIDSSRGEQCWQPTPQISETEMLWIIEGLDFSELGREHEERALRVSSYNIFNWLTRVAERFPELEQRGVVSYLTLGSLDSGNVRYSQVSYQYWRGDNWLEDKDGGEELQRCIELAPSTRIAIWSNGGRHCAVFQTEVLSTRALEFPYFTYIIVPDIRITRPEDQYFCTNTLWPQPV